MFIPKTTRLRGVCLLVGAFLLVGAAPLSACKVPVFRYALERWPADNYRAAVFHRGPLTESQQQLLARLRKAVADQDHPANSEVLDIDLNDDAHREHDEWWQQQKQADLPRLVLRYPKKVRTKVDPVWIGPLDDASVGALVDSPARRKLVDRILAGDSAVWVLLESGDKEADNAAAKALSEQLKIAEQTIQLPKLDELLADDQFKPDTKVELRLGFTVLRVSRDDADEQVFVRMLLGIEDDLADLKGPMAFPVFGRGRALYALVGAGINASTIREACAFVTGECSCTIKDLNPGVDLLTSVDWKGRIGGTLSETDVPDLTSLSALQSQGRLLALDVQTLPDLPSLEAIGAAAPGSAGDTNAVGSSPTLNNAAPSAAMTSGDPAGRVPVSPANASANSATVGQSAGNATGDSGSGTLLRNLILFALAGVLLIAVATVLLRRKPS